MLVGRLFHGGMKMDDGNKELDIKAKMGMLKERLGLLIIGHLKHLKL